MPNKYLILLAYTNAVILTAVFFYLHRQEPAGLRGSWRLAGTVLFLGIAVETITLKPLILCLSTVLSTVAVIGVMISSFLQARKKLSEKEKRFRRLTENAHDIVYRIRIKPGPAFEYINGAASAVTGYAPDEYYRDPELFFRIVKPEDALAEKVCPDRRTGLFLSKILRVKRPDESRVWLEQNTVPIYDTTGQVVAFEGIARDITAVRQKELELEYLSCHDALTGLGNRFHFERSMSALAARELDGVAIIVCDIDGLKSINDTYGHHCGDSIIKEAALLLQSYFREEDGSARIGGDEFAIILNNCREAEAAAACAGLRRVLREYNSKKTGLPLELSVGFAVGGAAITDPREIFIQADKSMYLDKQQKRTAATEDRPQQRP